MKRYVAFLNRITKNQEGIVILSYYDRPKYIGTFVKAEVVKPRRVRLHFSKKDLVLDFEPAVSKLSIAYKICLAAKNGRINGKHPECDDFWIGKMSNVIIAKKLGVDPRVRRPKNKKKVTQCVTSRSEEPYDPISEREYY